jgi:hypothetical protein
MSKQQMDVVQKFEETEAKHTLWTRLLGTHRQDALLNAQYSAGTLLGKKSLADDSRCGAMDIISIILFVMVVPFSPRAKDLLYGWSRGIATWKWIVFFPFIAVGLLCGATAQMFSLVSITLLVVSCPLLFVVSIALYGDQKITLRIIEDIPQLVISALFVARIEKNRSALVSIAGNALMLVLQTAKDIYYSYKYARKHSAEKTSFKIAKMNNSRSSLASLKTQLSAPIANSRFDPSADCDTKASSLPPPPPVCCGTTRCMPCCCPARATEADMLALSRLHQTSSMYEEDPCECTAYPTCNERPCTLYGRVCVANHKGDECKCCGAPCCIPGVKPWVHGLFASSYPDLTLWELLYLCFVTPLYMLFMLMPPFLFFTLWRLHHRRVMIVPAPPENNQAPAEEEGPQEGDVVVRRCTD